MRRPDRGVTRFFAWISLAVAVCFTVYLPVVLSFFRLLTSNLDQTFGTAFPAIPIVALLGVLFLLRWGDLHAVLVQEGSLRTEPYVRALGIVLLALPLPFASYSEGSLPASAVSLIVIFYGTSLVLNPRTKLILLPYTVLYVAGVSAPFILEFYLGQPFAGLASYVSAEMVRLSGIPVTWQGDQFEFVSRAGGTVTGVVTPGCSSILSVTTFLGLLGLMHFDMRKPIPFTVKLAAAGVFTLVMLNSVRILLLIWTGYTTGAAALWSLHNWVGYALFVGFYVTFLVVYTRAGGGPQTEPRAGAIAPAYTP